MNYNEAKRKLRIAEKLYNAEEYSESSDIVYKVANAVAFDTEMDSKHRNELIRELFTHFGRFDACDNEGYWEMFSEISSLLNKRLE